MLQVTENAGRRAWLHCCIGADDHSAMSSEYIGPICRNDIRPPFPAVHYCIRISPCFDANPPLIKTAMRTADHRSRMDSPQSTYVGRQPSVDM